MRAIIWTKYGPPEVLQLKEIEKPTPKDNEVLIKIHTTTVTSGDCEMRAMKVQLLYRILMRLYIGLRKPKRRKILGLELAGKIESVGKNVKSFKEGDEVFAASGLMYSGTYTEYICLPEDSNDCLLEKKPINMSFIEAAPIPMGGLEAFQYIGKGNVKSGNKVLINGAGGSIGTYAVQLAKHYGAEVTAVDSKLKLDMFQSIGADHIIDYTQVDFTKNGEVYDVILDLVSNRPFSDYKKSLKKKGLLILANPKLLTRIHSKFSSIRVMIGYKNPKVEDLISVKELIEQKEMISVIDRVFSLEEIVKAHRYVEKGNKVGHVIIKIVE